MRKTGVMARGSFHSLGWTAQAFIAVVGFLGLLVIGHSVYAMYSAPISSQWFLLAALTLLSGSITIKLPSVPATISVSETFVFTSVLLFGTAAGTITVTLDGLIISLWLQRNKFEVHKLIFNTTAPALSIWIAAEMFFRFTGSSPLDHSAASVAALLPGLFVFAFVYFLLNSWLMATAVSFEEPLSPLQVWRQSFLWLSLTFLSGASVSILLVSISREVNLSAIAIIVPLLVISYLTYHTSLGRVEDANRHVENLNELYLSTIQTLAMAIDAKDQVTHGHIRRVQDHSVCLARHLGVKDVRLLKAVEAASLLHDMGKLAIPEHILNKPGKLTDAEFSIMKTHSSVGADILAAIQFPYPVVPIVRHHHESWDGSGYPDGLSGTDIPIGARILAVVDCFDALTSDRPYRPKLASDEAIAILMERRGTMYDPLVVDAFLQFKESIGSADVSTLESRDNQLLLNWAPAKSRSVIPLPDSSSAHSRRLGTATFPYNVEVLAKYLTNSGSLLVLYLLDQSGSKLIVGKTWGAQIGSIDRLTIPLGKRVSGWVAITRRPVFSTGPALDFVGYTGLATEFFNSCAASPITVQENVLAVLTVYRRSALVDNASVERGLALTSEHLSSYISSASYRLN
jgi:putative nucleotidyltransferase with HDIG domain